MLQMYANGFLRLGVAAGADGAVVVDLVYWWCFGFARCAEKRRLAIFASKVCVSRVLLFRGACRPRERHAYLRLSASFWV